MALTVLPGRGNWFPAPPPIGLAPAFSTGLVIDATGEKLAFNGQVWFPARTGTKDIRRVQFRLGAVTKAGGSAFTVSLQDPAAAAGPPGQPDETQDQTVAIANADAGLTSNVWYRTGTFSADRTVAYGDDLSIVVEFDGAGRLGADSLIVNGITQAGNSATGFYTPSVLKTGGSFALNNAMNNVILEFSDGTFGILEGGVCWSAVNSHAYNSGSATADEHALAFQVPVECVIDGLWAAVVASGASADFDLVLYSGTTALVTKSFDANRALAAATARYLMVPIAETTLSPSTQYYLSVKPTTANNVTAYSFDVNDAAHMDVLDAGQAFNYSSRIDAGSWDAITTTRRLQAGIRLSQSHGAGAGGGHIMSRVRTGF